MDHGLNRSLAQGRRTAICDYRRAGSSRTCGPHLGQRGVHGVERNVKGNQVTAAGSGDVDTRPSPAGAHIQEQLMGLERQGVCKFLRLGQGRVAVQTDGMAQCHLFQPTRGPGNAFGILVLKTRLMILGIGVQSHPHRLLT